MNKRKISLKTRDRLSTYNVVRKLRADIFALSHRDLLSALKASGRTNHQIAYEMNKLGMQSNGRIPWTHGSITRLFKRLHKLVEQRSWSWCRDQHTASGELPDLEALDRMFYETLDRMYVGTTEFFRGDVIESPAHIPF